MDAVVAYRVGNIIRDHEMTEGEAETFAAAIKRQGLTIIYAGLAKDFHGFGRIAAQAMTPKGEFSEG